MQLKVRCSLRTDNARRHIADLKSFVSNDDFRQNARPHRTNCRAGQGGAGGYSKVSIGSIFIK